MKYILTLIAFFCIQSFTFGQEKDYEVVCVAFYNFENLFDTIDSPDTFDEEFTPHGGRLYNTKIYVEKLNNLSHVVSQIGTELTPDGAAILGVSEIENRKVLEDFVVQPKVKDRNYQIVHFDSPDRRGVDVGLLYQSRYFELIHARPIDMTTVKEDGDTLYTRDILFVTGRMGQDTVHVLVNHWPSRRGGEKRTRPYRNRCAKYVRNILDSLNTVSPGSKVIIMGDLNDDPTSPSVKNVLRARAKKNMVRAGELYNPMTDFYKKGYGTTAYRDAWSLFDQIIISHGLLEGEPGDYFYYQTKIFKERFMLQKSGRFKGYPLRTYAGGSYLGGYSDHFPVLTYFLKEKQGG